MRASRNTSVAEADGVAATNLSNTRGRGRLFPPHIEVRDETRHEHQIERTASGHLVINAHVAAIQLRVSGTSMATPPLTGKPASGTCCRTRSGKW